MNRVGLGEAVRLLKQGQVIAVPTDTAYALAALATDAPAITQVKRIKGRDQRKPIALIASSVKQVESFFILTQAERRLAKRYWPGPLTILLRPRARRLAHQALSPTSRIGVRVPRFALARRLCRLVGAPLTATSANRSGTQACYTISEVQRSLGARIPILPVSRLRGRSVSTVVMLQRGKLTVIRPGPVQPRLS